MAVVRRWYLFVSATIGLHGFAWALIWLLYGVMVGGDQISIGTTAFQLAALVICLPLWLIHWLWGERLARRDLDERSSAVRKLYLYGNLAALLLPLIGSVNDLVTTLLGWLLRLEMYDPTSRFWYGLIASTVLGALFAYHGVVARNDAHLASLTSAGALVRRIYLLLVTGVSLIVWTGGATDLIRLIFGPIGGIAARAVFLNAAVSLIVGLIVWIGHWWRAQRLFASADEDERASALRKFFLYLVIVGAMLVVVTNATVLLAALFRAALGLETSGALMDVLAPMLLGGLVAIFYTRVLRADVAAIGEAPRQAGARRLAWYLVAAIGQLAALAGAGGLLNVIIRGLFGIEALTDLRDPLAWFGAVFLVGVPIWGWCWRQIQVAAADPGPAGVAERSSLARRIYLFGFAFVASLTLLSALIYILFRIISILLGERFSGDLLAELSLAVSYALIAVGVLIAHALALRADTRVRQAAEVTRLSQARVAVLAEGGLASAIAAVLQRRFPQLAITVVDRAADPSAQLANADLIVGTWQPADDPRWLHASPARKLLLPLASPGWSWLGVETLDATDIPEQIANAVRQALVGEPIQLRRGVSAGTIVGVAIGIFVIILIVFGVVQVALFAFA